MNRRIREAFNILELHEHATLEEAKRTWRDLAQVWHPDKHQHNERIQAKVTEKLKAINSAWDEVQKWFAQQEQNEKDQTDEAHEEQERQRREADYKTYTCPHCGTMNRLPQNKPIESARCGKCAKFLSVVRESEELLKKERAEREQQNERERQKLRERQKERERQQAEETRWEALRKQANTRSEELEELRLRQSAHPQQQGPWNRFALLVILVLLVLVGFMFYAEKKNENRTGNGRHAAEQAHAVSYDLSSVHSSYSKSKLLKVMAFEGKYQDSKFHKLIYPELAKLVGKDLYDTLKRNLSTAGPIIREGKYIILEGCAPHSCGSDMAIVAIDSTFGILSVAILNSSEWLTFSDIPDKKNYPDIIMNWPVWR